MVSYSIRTTRKVEYEGVGTIKGCTQAFVLLRVPATARSKKFQRSEPKPPQKLIIKTKGVDNTSTILNNNPTHNKVLKILCQGEQFD